MYMQKQSMYRHASGFLVPVLKTLYLDKVKIKCVFTHIKKPPSHGLHVGATAPLRAVATKPIADAASYRCTHLVQF